MTPKSFALLVVFMLVSQAMCLDDHPPETDECDPADPKTCSEGNVCVHVEGCHPDPPNPPICHPHNKCVPKAQAQELSWTAPPVPNHIG